MEAMKYYRVIFDSCFGNPGKGELLMLEFVVIKTTPCGVWIYDDKYRHGKRFIITDSNRGFAKSTKAKALESYRFRSARRRVLLEKELKECETGYHASFGIDPESIRNYDVYLT